MFNQDISSEPGKPVIPWRAAEAPNDGAIEVSVVVILIQLIMPQFQTPLKNADTDMKSNFRTG